MNKKLHQYQILIPEEETELITKKMIELMKLEFDLDKLKKATRIMDSYDPKCICMFRDKENDDRFVMVDTGCNYLHTIVVQCEDNEHEIIKKTFLDACNEVREKYDQGLLDELNEYYDGPRDGYKYALERCSAIRF